MRSAFLSRFVAVILIPCLIADPSVAQLARPDVWRAATAQGGFTSQIPNPKFSLGSPIFNEQALQEALISPLQEITGGAEAKTAIVHAAPVAMVARPLIRWKPSGTLSPADIDLLDNLKGQPIVLELDTPHGVTTQLYGEAAGVDRKFKFFDGARPQPAFSIKLREHILHIGLGLLRLIIPGVKPPSSLQDLFTSTDIIADGASLEKKYQAATAIGTTPYAIVALPDLTLALRHPSGENSQHAAGDSLLTHEEVQERMINAMERAFGAINETETGTLDQALWNEETAAMEALAEVLATTHSSKLQYAALRALTFAGLHPKMRPLFEKILDRFIFGPAVTDTPHPLKRVSEQWFSGQKQELAETLPSLPAILEDSGRTSRFLLALSVFRKIFDYEVNNPRMITPIANAKVKNEIIHLRELSIVSSGESFRRSIIFRDIPAIEETVYRPTGVGEEDLRFIMRSAWDVAPVTVEWADQSGAHSLTGPIHYVKSMIEGSRADGSVTQETFIELYGSDERIHLRDITQLRFHPIRRYAVELKIPGELNDRDQIHPAHFELSQAMVEAYGSDPDGPGVIAPRFFMEFTGATPMYGKTLHFDENNRLGIAGFEYHDSKRFLNIYNEMHKSQQFLEMIAFTKNMPLASLLRSMNRQIAVASIRMHHLGYVGSTDDMTDMHAENIRLDVSGRAVLAGDFGAMQYIRRVPVSKRQEEFISLLGGRPPTFTPNDLLYIFYRLIITEKTPMARARILKGAIEELGMEKELAGLRAALILVLHGKTPTASNDFEKAVLGSVEEGISKIVVQHRPRAIGSLSAGLNSEDPTLSQMVISRAVQNIRSPIQRLLQLIQMAGERNGQPLGSAVDKPFEPAASVHKKTRGITFLETMLSIVAAGVGIGGALTWLALHPAFLHHAWLSLFALAPVAVVKAVANDGAGKTTSVRGTKIMNRLWEIVREHPGKLLEVDWLVQKSGWSERTVRKYMKKLAADPDSGILRRGGSGREYSGPRRRYVYQPADFNLLWNGYSDTELADGTGTMFYSHGDEDLLDFIFEKRSNRKLAQFSDGAGISVSKKDLVAALSAEALAAYSFLQNARGRFDITDLFKTLRQEGMLTQLDNPRALERALKWMELQGFPLPHLGTAWWVNGLAKKRFYSMDVMHWPAPQKERWLRWQGYTSGQAVAERLYLIKEVHGFTWAEMGIDKSWLIAWLRGDNAPMELTLEMIANTLGIDPVWLTRGYSRAEYELIVYKKLKRGAIPNNFYWLRAAAGLSVTTLAQTTYRYFVQSGLTRLPNIHVSLKHLGDGTARLLRPICYPFLAAALGQSPYRLLTGKEKDAALKRLTQGEQLRLELRAHGMEVYELAQELHVSKPTVKAWIQGTNQISPLRQSQITEVLNKKASTLPKQAGITFLEPLVAIVVAGIGLPITAWQPWVAGLVMISGIITILRFRQPGLLRKIANLTGYFAVSALANPLVLWGIYRAMPTSYLLHIGAILAGIGYGSFLIERILNKGRFARGHEERARQIFETIKKDTVNDRLLSLAFRYVSGMKAAGEQAVLAGGKDYTDGTVLYQPWMARFPRLMRYLITRRAMGFHFDDTFFPGECNGKPALRETLERNRVWRHYATLETLKRVRYYPTMLFYIIGYQLFIAPAHIALAYIGMRSVRYSTKLVRLFIWDRPYLTASTGGQGQSNATGSTASPQVPLRAQNPMAPWLKRAA